MPEAYHIHVLGSTRGEAALEPKLHLLLSLLHNSYRTPIPGPNPQIPDPSPPKTLNPKKPERHACAQLNTLPGQCVPAQLGVSKHAPC